MIDLILILVVVLLLFGSKKLRTIGADLGAAVKGFRKGLGAGSSGKPPEQVESSRPDAEFPEMDNRGRGGSDGV